MAHIHVAKVSKVWSLILHATFGAGMLFGWETVMTFVLVSVVYAVAVGEPSFGNVGPYAVGLSLFSMVFAGQLSAFIALTAFSAVEAFAVLSYNSKPLPC